MQVLKIVSNRFGLCLSYSYRSNVMACFSHELMPYHLERKTYSSYLSSEGIGWVLNLDGQSWGAACPRRFGFGLQRHPDGGLERRPHFNQKANFQAKQKAFHISYWKNCGHCCKLLPIFGSRRIFLLKRTGGETCWNTVPFEPTPLEASKAVTSSERDHPWTGKRTFIMRQEAGMFHVWFQPTLATAMAPPWRDASWRFTKCSAFRAVNWYWASPEPEYHLQGTNQWFMQT